MLIGGGIGLGLILLAESLSAGAGQPPAIASPSTWPQAATALAAILTWTLYRPGRKRWVAAVAVLSLTLSFLELATTSSAPRLAGVSVLGWTLEPSRGLGAAEGIALLLLMVSAVRHWNAPPGRWVAVVLGAAIVMIGPRVLAYPDSVAVGTVIIVLALTSAIGFGAYLRGIDRLRRRALEEMRRAERLEQAREMHDFVAHHVTGIVVLAQAAQATGTGPVKPFADIERAGLSALTSMRRMVRMLRDDQAGSDAGAVGHFSLLEEAVRRFAREGTDVSSFISPELVDAASPAIAATVHHVVREALTNVRKHAQAVHQVRVSVMPAGENGLEVSVRDDGRPAKGRLAASGAGMGLVGLRERVEAAGGRLRSEPRTEGGWETAAWLPLEPDETLDDDTGLD